MRAVALLIGATCLAVVLADLSAPRPDPWNTLAAIGRGLVSPDFSDWAGLARATGLTLAFAFCGVAMGAAIGLLLAPVYRRVRVICVSARAVHELFWALLLLNITGISPLTGVLAIGIPYAGIFARVFSDYLDEADPSAEASLPDGVPAAIRLTWVRIPQILPQMRTYTLYRLECGLRSSAVLGFIGLPTLGFELEATFRQGQYDQAAAVLMIFLLMILPMRKWMVWRLAPIYVAVSAIALMSVSHPPMGTGALARFMGDIVPAPLRTGADWVSWLDRVIVQQGIPGTMDTLVLGQLALMGAATLAAVLFPAIVPRVAGRTGAMLGHGVLVVLRSIPEYMLAFVFVQVLGASMLPAALALALHNGAIIAHLMGREAAGLRLRADAPTGLTLWGWELFPRLNATFWALCLYRWEIILRESAIMGLLGIATLGFFIQTNVQELRLDRVMVLLVMSIILTFIADHVSRALRSSMRRSAALRIEARRGRA